MWLAPQGLPRVLFPSHAANRQAGASLSYVSLCAALPGVQGAGTRPSLLFLPARIPHLSPRDASRVAAASVKGCSALEVEGLTAEPHAGQSTAGEELRQAEEGARRGRGGAQRITTLPADIISSSG